MANLNTMAFEAVIKNYLDNRASTDKLFEARYRNEKKSIKECCSFILETVKDMTSNGCIGLPDEEVFSMAVHYYDEEEPSNKMTLKDIESFSMSIIVPEDWLTEADKQHIEEQARDEAKEKYKNDVMALLEKKYKSINEKKANKPLPKKTDEFEQLSLF